MMSPRSDDEVHNDEVHNDEVHNDEVHNDELSTVGPDYPEYEDLY